MNGNEETDGVDTITDATKGERKANTQTINKGTSEETDNSKGTV